MRNSRIFLKIPLLALTLLMLCVSTVSASWAYAFVVNDGRLFVISDEKVSEDLIGDVVGEVTYHSTQEGSYNGNFSNHYEAGTQYYAIQGTSPADAIAIQTESGGYVKALYEREYGSSEDSIQPKQHSEIDAENSPRDNSMMVFVILSVSFAGLIAVVTILPFKDRRS